MLLEGKGDGERHSSIPITMRGQSSSHLTYDLVRILMENSHRIADVLERFQDCREIVARMDQKIGTDDMNRRVKTIIETDYHRLFHLCFRASDVDSTSQVMEEQGCMPKSPNS